MAEVKSEPRRVILYKNDAEAPADLKVGERVALVRGDGPREGEIMAWATVTEKDAGGSLSFRTEGTGNAPEDPTA